VGPGGSRADSSPRSSSVVFAPLRGGSTGSLHSGAKAYGGGIGRADGVFSPLR